jgi:ubiquinone biosynthesis protein UbiJ
MATQSPIPFLDTLFERLRSGLQPPHWMIEEVQRRLVLLLNHVLMQEPEARARLTRQSGRVVEARWRAFVVRLSATPAGLLDLASSAATPDLTLTLVEESPWELAQAALRGDKPPVLIAGDVQFAAEINWLVEHVRWDLEEDFARVIGDAPAHAIGEAGRKMVQALRQFARPAPGAAPAGTAGTPPTPTAGPGQATAASSRQPTSSGSGQA